MAVITSDQVNSRTTAEAAGEVMHALNARYGERLPLPVDRNAGDELQVLVTDGATAVRMILDFARDGRWRIGVGFGSVRRPLPASTREAGGGAFIAARTAVGSARTRPTRFAAGADRLELANDVADFQAIMDTLLLLHSQRTEKGWQLYDLLSTGMTQLEAAHRIGVSPQAVSARAAAADLWVDSPAEAALARIIDRIERSIDDDRQSAPGL